MTIESPLVKIICDEIPDDDFVLMLANSLRSTMIDETGTKRLGRVAYQIRPILNVISAIII